MQTFLQELIIPERIEADEATLTGTYGKFVAEPYERGYGHTIGNSMRRVLLSSLDGAAVVAARIKGTNHEYSTIPGVHEDVMNILLNLKELRIRMTGNGPETLYLSVKDKKTVKASDIKENANIEIINKDLLIANLELGTHFEAELEIARGTGYLTSEEVREKMNLPAEYIPMDARFSPITKVNYYVENARVGQRTDYDKLIIEVWTDGTIKPEDAVDKTARILSKSLTPFLGEVPKPEEKEEDGKPEGTDWDEVSVDTLDLSSRAANCLKLANIRTIGELISRKEEDLLAVKNFGQKSLDEIKEKLAEKGLALGQEQ